MTASECCTELTVGGDSNICDMRLLGSLKDSDDVMGVAGAICTGGGAGMSETGTGPSPAGEVGREVGAE